MRAERAKGREDFATFASELEGVRRDAARLLAFDAGNRAARVVLVMALQIYAAPISDPENKSQFLDEAIVHQRILVAGRPSDRDAKVTLAQLLVEKSEFCDGVDILRALLAAEGDDVPRLLAHLPEKSWQQFAVGAHDCDAVLSERVFEALLANGYLDPATPGRCLKCWGILGIVKRGLGKGDAFEAFFRERLKPHAPWTLATQLPMTFNSLIATEEPDYWREDTVVKGLLVEHADAIAAEYKAHEARATFDVDHADAWMATEDGGSTST
jgi:hypothetical protein